MSGGALVVQDRRSREGNLGPSELLDRGLITYDDLNPNQRQAAEWRDGPLLVLAGPGSGKTMVLTLRVARLLEDDEHASALALTFTNKAAAETRDRVDRRLGRHTDRVRLCTFHSFASCTLAQHGSHLGIRPSFRTLTHDEDRIAILEDVIRDLPNGDADLPPDRTNLLRLIDRLFSESYQGDGPSSSLPDTPSWLPTLFRGYCDALVAANCQDFGSLLHFANRLLRKRPGVARVVRLAWAHVCVDEFQDTNRAQYDLLRLIAPARQHNLFVVADDDQLIYQWNGASPRRFDHLRRDYELKTIELPQSYRCPPPIVDHANRLIDRNRERITSRKTVAVRETRHPYAHIVRPRIFDRQDDEAEFVGRDIGERELPPGDCMVLARTNRLAQRAAQGLQLAGIEAFVPQRKTDFDSPVAAVMVEALRLAGSRHDRVVLRRICRQWERLTGAVIEPHAVGAAAALVGGDFLRAWAEAAQATASETEQGRTALQRIRADLVDGLNFPGIVDWFLEGGWRSWSEAQRPDDGASESDEEEIATWHALHGEIRAEHGARVTLNTYLQHLDLASKAPPKPPNAVQCITVHRAKGLESDHVYLIGMAQEVFPSYRALQRGPHSKEVEEERRSCFVAITRARETLTLTRAREYFGYRKKPSQFLHEMGME